MSFREKLQRFMYGRYGADGLNQWMTYLVLGLMVLQLFVRWPVLSLLEMILIGLCIFRMFSKNIAQRSRENQTFYRIKGKIAAWFRREKGIFSQRREFHFYTCPKCKQKIRIPRGKGKICITCPKCRTEFIKKS